MAFDLLFMSTLYNGFRRGVFKDDITITLADHFNACGAELVPAALEKLQVSHTGLVELVNSSSPVSIGSVNIGGTVDGPSPWPIPTTTRLVV